MTIERYFAIVHPLKHFSAKKFLLLASVVAALLYNVPKFYEFEKKVGAVQVTGKRSPLTRDRLFGNGYPPSLFTECLRKT